MRLDDLRQVARLVIANADGDPSPNLAIHWWPKSVALVDALGALPGATRVTFRYAAEGAKAPHAIESAWLDVDGVMFNVSFDRPLAEGETMESTWHARAVEVMAALPVEPTAPAPEPIADDPAPKVIEVTPPKPTLCTESRWSWVEID